MNNQTEKEIGNSQKKVFLVIYVWFLRNKYIPVDSLVARNIGDPLNPAQSQCRNSLHNFPVKNSSVSFGEDPSTSKATISIMNSSEY